MSLEFPISERFTSFQGEGMNVGTPEYFIRLAGCNLAEKFGGCKWCDTPYSQHKNQGELLGLETILKEVPRDYPGRICVTGGEPLYHAGISDLFDGLIGLGFLVSVETNGSLPIASCRKYVHAGVSFAMDLKCPGSGMAGHNLFENIALLRRGDQLKFILADRVDYEYAKRVLKKYPCTASTFFQPAYHALDPKELAEWILHDKLSVRLSLQQQKQIWGVRRGV